MKLIPELTLAISNDSTLHDMIDRRPTQHPEANAGGIGPFPLDPDEIVVDLANTSLSTPETALYDYAFAAYGGVDRPSDEDLLAMIQGARKLRDWLDDFEKLTGRYAHLTGTTIRQLADATGVAERSAAARYRPIPGEGLTSPLTSPLGTLS